MIKAKTGLVWIRLCYVTFKVGVVIKLISCHFFNIYHFFNFPFSVTIHKYHNNKL